MNLLSPDVTVRKESLDVWRSMSICHDVRLDEALILVRLLYLNLLSNLQAGEVLLESFG